ncbi:hypothetical protein C0Q70_01869 [Pomacea canaliculata]|uniref:Chitin-binding type-4 domain-containing protein n=1 Tax=Pomacea canaliculata TaxID=400727 RepID=A0A2T7Q0P5_POMCA|nr:hypothetical protein C0Q70_01869 [Pomacea canaliculata]
MWRVHFSNPPNYDDNQLFCGGVAVQWHQNGGKCGLCGDPWPGPRENEAGGRYANGIVTRSYEVGQVIDVYIELTANHKRSLPVPDGAYSTKLDINLRLRLPQGLTCVACVFQWKYNAGNSWGKDPVTGKECVGCGPQEQFYGCADVAIGHKEMQIGLVPKRYPWYLQDPDSEWHYGVAYVSSDTAAISGAGRTLAEGRGVSEVALFTMLFALCVRRLQLIAIG